MSSLSSRQPVDFLIGWVESPLFSLVENSSKASITNWYLISISVLCWIFIKAIWFSLPWFISLVMLLYINKLLKL